MRELLKCLYAAQSVPRGRIAKGSVGIAVVLSIRMV